jgi:hypothetical protein
MLTIDLFEELEGPPEPTLIDALRDFLPLAVKHLKIKKLPKIKLLRDVETEHMPSFGKFSNDDRTVHLGIKNRHPNDILRTLAHEMVHYAQGQRDELDADSGVTGSPEEDQANAEAGVIMREFNQQFPQYMELKPIMVEKWTQKYKKSINCNNPKGFSQRAHCQGRKKNTNEAEDSKELPQWKKDWYAKQKPNSWPKHPQPYHNPNWIDELSPEERKKLIGEKGVAENFADGKNPQDKGDSQRHGIPKGATMAELEKAAKASGRKGQLARWQINMRRGKKK